MQEKPSIYLAGSLFCAADRIHLLQLERLLKSLGYTVLLPQRRALKFGGDNNLNVGKMVADCLSQIRNKDNIVVACIDGADADSGTVFELGVALVATGRAIVYRTDFRTDTKRQMGVNGMLTAKGVQFIYFPCYVTELNKIGEYYKKLADKIDRAIQEEQN